MSGQIYFIVSVHLQNLQNDTPKSRNTNATNLQKIYQNDSQQNIAEIITPILNFRNYTTSRAR